MTIETGLYYSLCYSVLACYFILKETHDNELIIMRVIKYIIAVAFTYSSYFGRLH